LVDALQDSAVWTRSRMTTVCLPLEATKRDSYRIKDRGLGQFLPLGRRPIKRSWSISIADRR